MLQGDEHLCTVSPTIRGERRFPLAALEKAPKYRWTPRDVKDGGCGYEGGVPTQVGQVQKRTQEHDGDPCEEPGETPECWPGEF